MCAKKLWTFIFLDFRAHGGGGLRHDREGLLGAAEQVYWLWVGGDS